MAGYAPLFANRTDAGRALAARLAAMGLGDPVVYALPRGGVPLAVEIGRVLEAPVDLVLVRKIGAPGSPELALAAVVVGEDAQTVVNEAVAELTGADAAYLEKARRRELAEIERRRVLYFAGRRRISPAGRTAIVVDDGLATGATAKAAPHALKRQGAARVFLAVPVAPKDTLEAMRGEADDIVCLNPVEQFWGVGAFYDAFHQMTDEETLGLLRQAWSGTGGAAATQTVSIAPLGLFGASTGAAAALRAAALLDLRPGCNVAVRADLREPRLERYIGVVYRPQTELQSHYALSALPDQFDGFVWFDETRAVTPLDGARGGVPAGAEDETYPFGL